MCAVPRIWAAPIIGLTTTGPNNCSPCKRVELSGRPIGQPVRAGRTPLFHHVPPGPPCSLHGPRSIWATIFCTRATFHLGHHVLYTGHVLPYRISRSFTVLLQRPSDALRSTALVPLLPSEIMGASRLLEAGKTAENCFVCARKHHRISAT